MSGVRLKALRMLLDITVNQPPLADLSRYGPLIELLKSDKAPEYIADALSMTPAELAGALYEVARCGHAAAPSS